jgi:trehalose-phosphatase
VDDLKKLLDLESLPELWGCHGLERFTTDGQYQIAQLPEETTKKLASLYSWISENQLLDSCEFKPSGAAFHWRGRSPAEGAAVRDRIMARWHSEAEESKLELLDFDGGIEIRVAGTNKAVPVKTLLETAGPDAVSAYLGDDLTDEDAFKAIKGSGIAVLVKDELRETRADLWLTPPDELVDFLNRWT